jgi:hypothetical protein
MAVLKGGIRFSRYRVIGEPPADFKNAFQERITLQAHREFQESDSREEALGWVCVDDIFDAGLFPDRWLVSDSIFLTLRKDVRKVPSKYLAHECAKVEREWKQKFDRERLSKAEREEIKEMKTRELSKKVLPTITGVDMCWELKRNEVLFFSNAKLLNDTFTTLFEKTFQLKLRPLYPFVVALETLGEGGQASAEAAHEASFAQGGAL